MSRMATSNLCEKAERRQSAALTRKFRGLPEFCVATIDFGTTHCSVSYLVYPGTPDERFVQLKLDTKNRPRVPNCVLFGKHGRVIAFGYKARTKYATSQKEKMAEYYYFEHVKKNFQRTQGVNRRTVVEADNGKQCYLLDVIAQILFFLKKMVEESLEAYECSDVDWVITVPAIWRAGGKQMMREAAYKAGLCSNDPDYEIPPLTPATELCQHDQPDCPDKLSLALEPECAAIHCQKSIVRKSKCYIVVDIGGGTVDTACHKFVDGHIEEVYHPTGNDWGGTKVNEQFQMFLEDLVEDRNLSIYVGNGAQNQLSHKADLKDLLYSRFEEVKVDFGEIVSGGDPGDEPDEYVVQFPPTFWTVYERKLVMNAQKLSKDGMVTMDSNDKYLKRIRISYAQMEIFFQPAVTSIFQLLKSLLSEDACREVDTLYLVGGFGGCPFLKRKLERAISMAFGKSRCKIFTPPEPELAVVCGATAFRCNPSIVRQRKVDATYGVLVKDTFRKGFHNKKYKIQSEDGEKCTNLFSPFVEVNDSICTGELLVQTYRSLKHDQKVSVWFYSSPNKDVFYVTDPGVQRLGEGIIVHLEGLGPHQIEVVFDFTHTEIQVQAYQIPSGKEFKTVIDFLSDI